MDASARNLWAVSPEVALVSIDPCQLGCTGRNVAPARMSGSRGAGAARCLGRRGSTTRAPGTMPAAVHGLEDLADLEGSVDEGQSAAGDDLAGLVLIEAAHVEQDDERLPADHHG
jgi:hypothetical protein